MPLRLDGTLAIECSEAFAPLLEPGKTYRAAYGGRAGMKSYFFADLHLARALSQPGYRALCVREVQKSIKESSKRLLEERIEHHGIGHMFHVLETEIRTPGGGEFVFAGLQNHTSESVKSYQGFDVADIEEAQTIRQRSLDLLIPTIIRKDGAEIWARWNPRHEGDAIDKLFRGGHPPPNSVCVQVGWQDNPYLNEQTLRQIDQDYDNDPDKASHIWGGEYEQVTEGAYYARHIAQLDRDGRIGAYPYDPELPVKTSWDIGVDDYTAIWFFQEHWSNGRPRVRVIDYYETNNEGPDTIVPIAIHAKPYRYAMHYLPHDVKVREWGAGARSRLITLHALRLTPISPGVLQGPQERINAVRALLPVCEFDSNPAVMHGIKRLRRYSRKFNQNLGVYQGPSGDENSHGADAFGEYAINSPLLTAVKLAPQETKFTDYRAPDPVASDLGRL